MREKIQKIAVPLAVGVVMLTAIAAFFYFIQSTTRVNIAQDGYKVFAMFTDATGLSKRSTVRIAGIPVGIIEDIELIGNQAKIIIKLDKSIILHSDARLTKLTDSPVLGEYFLELAAGTTGDIIGPGGEIKHVVTQGDIEVVFSNLEHITQDIGTVTTGLKQMLVAEEGFGSLQEILKKVEGITVHLDSTMTNFDQMIAQNRGNIEGTLKSVNKLTENLTGISEKSTSDYDTVSKNIRETSESVKKLIDELNNMAGTNRGEIEESVANVRDILEKLNSSVDNLVKVSEDIRNGRGTIGKLASDPTLAEDVSKTVKDVSHLTERISRLRTIIGLRSESHFRPDNGSIKWSSKSLLSLRLQPRWDKYYQFEFVDDNRPKITRKTVSTRVFNVNTGATDELEERTVEQTEDYKISFLFARRLGPAVFKIGLIEDTGGSGVDVYFFEDNFTFTVDAFDFTNPDADPHLRTYLSMRFFKYFYLFGGVDDLINTDMTDGFAGAGIQFTDDDLFGVFTVTPTSSVK